MDFLFLDTETGGLTPYTHSLLQVGLVAYKDGKIADKLEFGIKLDDYVTVPAAMAVNGLDLEELKKTGLTPIEALEAINSFCQRNFNEKPVLVGHNPSIDKYMVRQLYDSQGLEMDHYISHRMIDTMSLIWGLYLVGKLPIEACSSSGAFAHFGIKVEKRHHALDDCVATVELFEKIMDILSQDTEMTGLILTPEELDEIRQYVFKATPGEWYFEENDQIQQLFAENTFQRETSHDLMLMVGHPLQLFKAPKKSDEYAEYWLPENDKIFVARSRADMPRLLSHVDKQNEEIIRLKGILSEIQDRISSGEVSVEELHALTEKALKQS